MLRGAGGRRLIGVVVVKSWPPLRPEDSTMGGEARIFCTDYMFMAAMPPYSSSVERKERSGPVQFFCNARSERSSETVMTLSIAVQASRRTRYSVFFQDCGECHAAGEGLSLVHLPPKYPEGFKLLWSLATEAPIRPEKMGLMRVFD